MSQYDTVNRAQLTNKATSESTENLEISLLCLYLFAVEVLRVIGLSPCHAFGSSTMIKVFTMQILWPSSSL